VTRDETIAILEMDREDAIQAFLILAEKAEKYDRLCDKPGPTTPFRFDTALSKAHKEKEKTALRQEKGT